MSIFAILTIISALALVLTLIPYPSAKKNSLLGYRALCTFTPISTGILAIPTVIFAVLWLIA
jgi:hypothetical protein